MERDSKLFTLCILYRISTHTLTWSVTTEQQICDDVLNISTHTLTWSVTVTDYDHPFDGYHFNSHAHVERDEVLPAPNLPTNISTHTLTWSVT